MSQGANRPLVVAIVVLAALGLIGLLLVPGMMGGFGGMMGGYGYAYSWPAALVGLLALLAFMAAIVLGAIWLIRALGVAELGPHAATVSPPTGDTAMEILRRRFAAGEITREQFDQMRQVLE